MRGLIFAGDKKISEAQSQMLVAEMQSFCQSWTAHDMPVTGSAQMMYDQFLFVAADERTFPTGCSTDEMFRRVRMIGETYGIEFFGTPRVQYRDGDLIKSINRFEFGVVSKNISSDAIVFDNTLTTLQEFRNGKWELPARESWHKNAFEFQA